jgi:hypothetical protein
MIEPASRGPVSLAAKLHDAFLALVPKLETHARIQFRHIECPGKRADKIAETIALAWK